MFWHRATIGMQPFIAHFNHLPFLFRFLNIFLDDSRRGVPPGGITEPLSPVNQGNPYEDMPVDQIAEAETEFDRLYERTGYPDDNNGKHFL